MVAVTVGAGVALPVSADPLDDARAAAARWEERVSLLEEQYNEILDRLDASRVRQKLLAADIAAKQLQVGRTRQQVVGGALEQFQSRRADPTLQLFTAADPDGFLQQLSTADVVRSQHDHQLSLYEQQLADLDDLYREQRGLVSGLADEERRAADVKADAEEALAQAEQDVQRLSLEQMWQTGELADDFDPARSMPAGQKLDKRAAKAVRFAAAQIGKRYVWATAGPDTFDCSGLTLAAYRAAGVSLPHYSAAQARLGQPVRDLSDMRPGDLIFWYSPIHHVGMYVGNGMFVHARNPKVGVVAQTVASYDVPITAVRRITG